MTLTIEGKPVNCLAAFKGTTKISVTEEYPIGPNNDKGVCINITFYKHGNESDNEGRSILLTKEQTKQLINKLNESI